MELHFYASIETINGIHAGNTMFVHTKEGRIVSDDIHVSFDTKYYRIEKVVTSKHLYKVKKL